MRVACLAVLAALWIPLFLDIVFFYLFDKCGYKDDNAWIY